MARSKGNGMNRTRRDDAEVLASLGSRSIVSAWYAASPDGCEDDTLILELDDGRQVHVRAYASHEDAILYLEEFVPE